MKLKAVKAYQYVLVGSRAMTHFQIGDNTLPNLSLELKDSLVWVVADNCQVILPMSNVQWMIPLTPMTAEINPSIDGPLIKKRVRTAKIGGEAVNEEFGS